LTDIKDPKIDEKPPPYECSSCGYTTWSWTEAKHHICKTDNKPEKKTKPPIEFPKTEPHLTPTGQQVEDLVRMTLEARGEHPDWSDSQIVQSVMKSYRSVRPSN